MTNNAQEQLLRGVGVTTCRDLYDKRGEIRLLFSELSSNFYLAVSQGKRISESNQIDKAFVDDTS